MNPMSSVFWRAISHAQQKITGATIRANISNPETCGSSTSTTKKAGIVAKVKISVGGTECATACPTAAGRAVATAARIAAVDPCGQSLSIQKTLTSKTARAARKPVHNAAIASLEWVKRTWGDARFSPEA